MMIFLRVIILVIASVGGSTGISLNVTQTVQYLTSPNYPGSYPSNADFQWEFLTSNPDLFIAIRFLDFDMESSRLCAYDRVTITTGGIFDGRYCGALSSLPAIFTQTTTATLTLISDGSINGRGFRLEYFMALSDPFVTDPTATILISLSVVFIVISLVICAVCFYIYHKKKKNARVINISMSLPLSHRQPLPPIKPKKAFINKVFIDATMESNPCLVPPPPRHAVPTRSHDRY